MLSENRYEETIENTEYDHNNSNNDNNNIMT